jgi:hypothetical protein
MKFPNPLTYFLMGLNGLCAGVHLYLGTYLGFIFCILVIVLLEIGRRVNVERV